MSAATTTMGRRIETVVPASKTGSIPIRLIGTLDCDGAGTNHPLAEVDPFILLDAGVIRQHNMPPFGAHPHRGHSVVTILMQGKVKSWDSFRSKDESHIISAPASYWVDAGSGVFHDEKSVIEDESDARQHMRILQLWVGVQEKDRSKPPRVQYDQDLPIVDVYSSNDKNGVVGKALYHVGGPNSKIETPHPVTVVHITQHAGTTYRVPIDPSHGACVVNLKGTASFGGTCPQNEYDVLVLTTNDDNSSSPGYLEVTTQDNSEETEYIVCSGERHKETWAKKLVANGALIAATADEARALAPKVDAMSKAGKAAGGSFAPFGME